MIAGPQPCSHQIRMARALEIARKVQAHFGRRTLAAGLYGSLARQSDGPFSDIEMHVLIEGMEHEQTLEWSEGPWKAEVNLYSPEIFLAQAAELDSDWSITHGGYAHVLPLLGDDRWFTRARERVFDHPEEEIRPVLEEAIIGDLYEIIGKLRNARATGNTHSVPTYAFYAAHFSVCIAGLWNRHLYTSTSVLYDEALQLPDRPAGFDAFLQRILQGNLTDAQAIFEEADALWLGFEEWANTHRLTLYRRLEDLLEEVQNSPRT